jgi:hypothetical protein
MERVWAALPATRPLAVRFLATLLAISAIGATICVAQAMPPPGSGGDPHGGMQQSQGIMASSRTDFGNACGIRDSSAQSATRYSRSAEGKWSLVTDMNRPGPQDRAAARVWREVNWMVDLHEAPGQGITSMHTGQMCFDSTGRITRMIDRYMDMTKCNCLRYTVLTFATDGRAMRRQQRYMNVVTSTEIAAPEAAKDFPEVWGFRRVQQLPFYSLFKQDVK